jgi:hypothetical protein
MTIKSFLSKINISLCRGQDTPNITLGYLCTNILTYLHNNITFELSGSWIKNMLFYDQSEYSQMTQWIDRRKMLDPYTVLQSQINLTSTVMASV